jgi:hypothetical protein
MRQNITIQRPPTGDEIAARVAFFDQSQRDADRINAELVLAGAQQREFESQSALVEKTQLSVEQLCRHPRVAKT